MSKLKEAVKEYVESFPWKRGSDYSQKYCHDAFIAGAQWQLQQSPWISVEERMPEDNQLVLTSSGIYGTKLLVWNECHNVWDYEDGDDVYCERDKIDAWMPIPEL